jgi:hypothetical protein
MELFGHIDDTPVRCLVDSGANTSFISDRIAKSTNGLVSNVSFVVTLPNGTFVTTTQVTQVKLSLRGLLQEVTLVVFPVKGWDVILGVDWLRSFESIQADWHRMRLEVRLQGRNYLLTNDKSRSVSPRIPDLDVKGSESVMNLLSAKGVERIAKKNETIYLATIRLRDTEDDTDETKVTNDRTKTLLQDYADVFTDDLPQGPPTRNVRHAIDLLSGSTDLTIALSNGTTRKTRAGHRSGTSWIKTSSFQARVLTTPSDLRPISIPNSLVRIIQRWVARCLDAHADSLLHPAQNAFVPKRDIRNNISHVANFVRDNKQGWLLFIDFAKAYDSAQEPKS